MCETTIEEILEAQNGDEEKFNQIVKTNEKLIWSIVKRFQNNKHETEDLFQIGALGFIKSIKRFDKNYNVQLSTFAVPYIIGEIKRFLRDDGTVKVSRSLKELNTKIKMLEKEYEKLGKELTIEVIEKELKESKENIILAMESDKAIKSIEEENEEGEKDSNTIKQIKVESHENDTIRNIILKDEIKKLNEKEKQIIILRYFYGKTQSEIAQKLNTSQVQISRIEKNILLKMRENIKESEKYIEKNTKELYIIVFGINNSSNNNFAIIAYSKVHNRKYYAAN